MPQSAGTRARRRVLAVAALVVLVAGASGGAVASAAEPVALRAFHVSPTGSDSADGRTPQTAWRSLDRANRHVFAPGDQLLLEGGATFPGWLYLDPADAGDAAAPVVVGSYGSGRAVIRAVGTPGIYVYDTAGVSVRDLVLVGDAASYQAKGGISFYNDLAGDRRLPGVSVQNVDVSGFRHGVEIGGARGASGFRDVTVSDASLHDNRDAGLLTYGPAFAAAVPTYAHAAVRVSRVSAFRNVGNAAERNQNTGSGIVLGSVAGGVIERSTAYENGSASVAPEGPAGIWTYDSHQVRIEHNVSYRNRTGGLADGDGFDLDQNVSSSVLQYNLSYENDGAGYLVWTAQANTAHRDNVVRFNISSNDARKIGWYGGITLSGALLRTEVYGNTVWMTGGATRPPALRMDQGLSRVSVRDNVLAVDAAGPAVASPALGATAVTMQGNDYFARTGTFALQWGKNYSSVAAWQKATGAEMLNGRSTGLQVNPGLVDPRPPVTITSAQSPRATGFSLSATSPLLGRGVDLTRGGTVDVGPADHFGTALTGATAPYDIGAHQPSQAGAAASLRATVPMTEGAAEVAPGVVLAPATISAGQPTVVSYRGTPGATLDILSRTQPATAFSKIGTVTLDRNGLGTSTHKPQKNTRITARTAAGEPSADAPLVAVRSVASFSASRVGTRTFVFTGRVYPALANRLVNVYRNGVLIAQGRSDATGIYGITRTLAAGTYTFQARTPNDQSNLGATSRQLRLPIT